MPKKKSRARIANTRRKRGRGSVVTFPNYRGIHRFKQSVSMGTFSNGIVPVFGSYYFSLNQLDQASTFTSLFDQYRIDKVVIKFLPRSQTTNLPATTAGAQATYMLSVIDYDDASTPATLAELFQYDNCKVHDTIDGKMKRITLSPHVAIAAYSGAFTSFANKGRQWIDVASPTVQHYGMKLAYPQGALANSISYDLVADYYVSFKSVR